MSTVLRPSQGVLNAPFPYFGGKSRIAADVWARFGDVRNYVEPFFGSGAMLLSRPNFDPQHPFLETVNDLHAYVANFWRAMKVEPEALAEICDNPVNECDLEAWHKWLVTASRKQELSRLVKASPNNYDVTIAGRWCWGLCQWIAGGWCTGEWFGEGDEANSGPGVNVKDSKRGGKLPDLHGRGKGVHKKRPDLVSTGVGVHKKFPNLVNAGVGVFKQKPALGNYGQGVHRKRPELERGKGVFQRGLEFPASLHPCSQWFEALAERLKRVRVCCGDWSRVLTKTPTTNHGLTAVFLDPPYGSKRERCYAEESYSVAMDVLKWCIANGDNRHLRIALCGHAGEHDMLEYHGWKVLEWKTRGGYSVTAKTQSQGRLNSKRERVWFSPHCLQATSAGLLF